MEQCDTERQIVVFKLDLEAYGVSIDNIKEIITMRDITGVPRSADFIEGIINLRGNVIPIFNLRMKFGLAEKVIDKSTRIMVVEVAGNVMGLIVDSVNEVIRLKEESIEPPSGTITAGVERQFIEGIAKVGDRLIIILELANVLPETARGQVDLKCAL
ncbi:MAG: chemotaxis protein CheW [Firmicutes bacterium HGW-Firmicutes-14]|nr:MAG: chemotaxis protein CheW [Firmicutes bacterium HGW-Firmicutes-14]